MLVEVDGRLPPGVTAKDIILAVIGEIGTAGGTGYAIEYAGEAVRALSMEGRMTICNMSIEGGARAGMVAPDEKTYAYLKDRPKSPKGAGWDAAMRYWETLALGSRRGVRCGGETRRRQAAAAGHLGNEPRAGHVDHRPCAGPLRNRRRAQAQGGRDRARLHGIGWRREDHRDRAQSRLHRFLHQRAYRRSARGCACGERQDASTRTSAP